MGDYEKRKAEEAHEGIERQSRQAHHAFEGSNQSVLGSGQSTSPEPAQAGGGSLDLLTMTMTGVVTGLGVLATAAIAGRGVFRGNKK